MFAFYVGFGAVLTTFYQFRLTVVKDDEAGTAHSVGRMFLFLPAYSYVSVVIRVFKSMHCVIVSKVYQLKIVFTVIVSAYLC